MPARTIGTLTGAAIDSRDRRYAWHVHHTATLAAAFRARGFRLIRSPAIEGAAFGLGHLLAPHACNPPVLIGIGGDGAPFFLIGLHGARLKIDGVDTP